MWRTSPAARSTTSDSSSPRVKRRTPSDTRSAAHSRASASGRHDPSRRPDVRQHQPLRGDEAPAEVRFELLFRQVLPAVPGRPWHVFTTSLLSRLLKGWSGPLFYVGCMAVARGTPPLGSDSSRSGRAGTSAKGSPPSSRSLGRPDRRISLRRWFPRPADVPARARCRRCSRSSRLQASRARSSTRRRAASPGRSTRSPARLETLQGRRPADDELLITSGAIEALELVGKSFLDRGDVVVVEGPTYLGAIMAFRSFEARLVAVPMDERRARGRRARAAARRAGCGRSSSTRSRTTRTRPASASRASGATRSSSSRAATAS